MDQSTQTSLRVVLRDVANDRLPYGWIYFPKVDEIVMDTPCLFVPDGAPGSNLDESGIAVVAVSEGFPVEGLDTDTIRETITCLRQQNIDLTDNALLQSFVYYLKYDAFLPRLGAPKPPPPEERMRKMDREFFDLLGNESSETICAAEQCARGRISHSVFCRIHHFESVRRKPCPFSD